MGWWVGGVTVARRRTTSVTDRQTPSRSSPGPRIPTSILFTMTDCFVRLARRSIVTLSVANESNYTPSRRRDERSSS